MLSRATTLDDLLLLRAPGVEFLLRGPPAALRERLQMFARRTEAADAAAEAFAREFGLDRFIH